MPVFDLQGHRGARGLFAENTLAGFAGTLALGVTSIELDVIITQDGVPVVLHDAVLDPDITRGPDGHWIGGGLPPVGAMTLAELRRFDVGRIRLGSALAAEFPDQAGQDGLRIPTLAEVLALVPFRRVRLDIELKTDPRAPHLTATPEAMAGAVLQTAAAAGALAHISVRSFDWRGLAWLRRTHPGLPLAWLTDAETAADPGLWWDITTPPGGIATVDAVARAADTPGWVPLWAPHYDGLTAADIEAAHALGLRVVPWTVNAPAAMRSLIAAGVDGLCTDRPDLARIAMAEAGLPLPPPR